MKTSIHRTAPAQNKFAVVFIEFGRKHDTHGKLLGYHDKFGRARNHPTYYMYSSLVPYYLFPLIKDQW